MGDSKICRGEINLQLTKKDLCAPELAIAAFKESNVKQDIWRQIENIKSQHYQMHKYYL